MWLRGLAVLLLMVPAGAGQVALFSDDAADVRGTTSDGRVNLVFLAGDRWPNLDIRAGGVQGETDETISFYLNVTDLEAQQDPPVPRGEPSYGFHFRYGEQGYRLFARTDLPGPASSALGTAVRGAWLEIEYDEDVFHRLGEVPVHLDFQQEQIVWEVPRSLLRDHNQAPLGLGDWLWDFHAWSRSMGWFGVPVLVGQGLRFEVGPPAFSDQAPGGALRGEAYQTVAGKRLHQGDLLASSLDPVRWTNGEATTFVYYVQVRNTGTSALDVTLGHEGADPMWQVAFSDRLRVPAQSAINVTYHVAIPFGHHHGKLHEFDVTFTTDDGQDWARQPLAVYWPSVPQPAGHHPELWLHSRYEPREPPFETMGDRVHGWWSAAPPEAEPYDEELPVPAHRIQAPRDAGMRAQADWVLRLEPSLRMGLDFILDQPVTGQVAMAFPVQAQDLRLEMEIFHVDRRFILPRETLLAEGESTLSGTVQGTTSFPFELMPLPESDLIRHLPRAELEFRLRLTGVFPGDGFDNPPEYTPTLLPAGTLLRLPLLEYHDPLDTVFWTDASATITVGPEGQEKPVNPGDQVLFTFILHYQGSLDTSFRIELSGVNSQWARVVGDGQFRMKPGDDREVAVAIQPPPGAVAGEYAEIAVKAVGTVNAAVQAGMVVRANVAIGTDVADETEQVLAKQAALSSATKGSSMAWLWVLPPLALVAGGGVAWRLRPEWFAWLRR